MGADDFAKRASAVGTLFRAGFDPNSALAAAGLPTIEHTGTVSVSVRSEEEVTDPGDGEDTEGVETDDEVQA